MRNLHCRIQIQSLNRITSVIYEVVLVIILLTGYVGNFFTVIILRYEQRLRSFTKSLLYIQAFWDTMMLLVAGTRYFIRINNNFDIRDINFYFKNIHWYITYLCMDCAAWTLCALSTERMCLVVWPTNVYIRHAKFKDALALSVIFVLCSTVMHTSMYLGTNFNLLINSFISLVFRVLIPSAILLSTSLTILYKLNANFRKISPNDNSKSSKSALFVLKMVLVVAIYHFVTTSPMEIFLMVSTRDDDPLSEDNQILYNISYNGVTTLMLSNASAKFYLYNLTNPNMRNGMQRIYRKIILRITKKEHPSHIRTITTMLDDNCTY